MNIIKRFFNWYSDMFKSKKIIGKFIIILLSFFVICMLCSLPISIINSDNQATEENKVEVSEIEMPTDVNTEEQKQTEIIEENEVIETVEIIETPTTNPTPTQENTDVIKPGTYIVGTDIQPGIYVGNAGFDLLGSCYWARLSNLSGNDNINANDNAEGLFYLEVLPTDIALETRCDITPIDKVPQRGEFLTKLPSGIYIIGRDIEPGIFKGEAGADFLESCYWARLSNVSGINNILANNNATGQFFIEVLPTDFALQVRCEVNKVE